MHNISVFRIELTITLEDVIKLNVQARDALFNEISAGGVRSL